AAPAMVAITTTPASREPRSLAITAKPTVLFDPYIRWRQPPSDCRHLSELAVFIQREWIMPLRLSVKTLLKPGWSPFLMIPAQPTTLETVSCALVVGFTGSLEVMVRVCLPLV